MAYFSVISYKMFIAFMKAGLPAISNTTLKKSIISSLVTLNSCIVLFI